MAAAVLRQSEGEASARGRVSGDVPAASVGLGERIALPDQAGQLGQWIIAADIPWSRPARWSRRTGSLDR